MSHAIAPRRRICMISHEVIGEMLAGPGIRYLELARVLAEQFDLILAAPNPPNVWNESFALHSYTHGIWPSLQGAVEGAEILIASGFSLYEFPALQQLGIPTVIDIYDPFPLESYHTFEGDEGKLKAYRNSTVVLDALTRCGDLFLCANERQRDWWLGVLQGAGRVNPATMNDDATLRRLIDELPYGFPSHPFAAQGRGPRTRPSIAPDDKLILWGGGLWNWLDPLTVIRAMPQLLESVPNARLLFPGTRHPNPTVPPMARTQEAFDLAEALGLRDSHIFFEAWVPYDSWPAYLADADVAVSLHYNTLETRFAAVRSRILSYIWARLPTVATEGDVASTLIAQHGIGEVVPEQDAHAVATALQRILAQGKATYASHFDGLAQRYTWHRVAQPLVDFCHHPYRAADKIGPWPARFATIAMGPADASTPLPSTEADALRAELAAAHDLIERYESGRFMRLMKRLKRGLDRFVSPQTSDHHA
ncbi:MAG: glycosyltransferase family 4 protein [Anaerolineales bacterium]|nr:glycosyltransferase family 4 protein [Anaerolineales bacterium]MCB9128842.1 glycosyltransferase family 4 protein [Ardenticatenales bacterium]